MDILTAAAVPVFATNPVLGVVVTAGVIGITAACASHKKKSSVTEPRFQSAVSVVEKTTKTAREMNSRIETVQKTEAKQRSTIQSEVRKAKLHAKKTNSCHQILRVASSNIEAQTEMTHDQLRAMERLQQDLASTQRSLLDTQRQLVIPPFLTEVKSRRLGN